NIGRVTCIATDKTGTITTGILTVTHLLPVPDSTDDTLLQAALVASRREGDDPLDRALFAAARGRALMPREAPLATFAFTETRRRETALIATESGLQAVTKGAPETVIALADKSDLQRDSLLDQAVQLSAEGHKVIAVAMRALPVDWSLDQEPLEDYVLLGLVAVEDPIRPEVPAALTACREAGIQVVMVTGDHPATALAIAREAGVADATSTVLTGDQLDAACATMTPAQLRALRVVARALPAQKLQLVQALQRAGAVVAVTGDGINDAPALRAADVGIAMGARGAQTTREVADIVLLNDNFMTVVLAIAEAQALFRNLRRSFAYLLLIHFPLVTSAAVLPLLGFDSPYLPIHIVWLELIIHPTALLAFQHASELRLWPADEVRSARLLTMGEIARLTLAAVFMALLIVLVFMTRMGDEPPVDTARTLALALLVTTSACGAVCLGGMRTRLGAGVVAGTTLGSIALIQIPFFASVLHVVPMGISEWELCIVVVGLIVGVILGPWK
ncbi:MAG: HAD-IC family P-type ATPase, partial [bacterium]